MKLNRYAFVLTASLCFTVAFGQDAVKVIPPQQKVLSASNGRYVFGQISDYRRDQFMLDTQTGRLWAIVTRKSKNPDGSEAPGDGFAILDPIPYANMLGELGATPR